MSSCDHETREPLNEQILARVGNRVITAEDFKYSYEFSFAPLRRGENPRRTYLNYMIQELLLAKEGFRLGFHKRHYVTSRVANRKRNNLLEAFHQKYVHRKVEIPEEKLQDAIKKSTVKWRMIIWPTPTLAEAQEARAEAVKSSLEDFIEQKIASEEVPLKQKRFYETDWVDYLDLKPEVLEKIKDLEVGKVSEPIPYGSGYALAQILDINLEGVKVEELQYGARRKQIYTRLYDIEADQIVHQLMDSLLTPMDVRLKGSTLERLESALFDWFAIGLPETSLPKFVQTASDTSAKPVRQLQAMLHEPLLTFNGGQKSVLDFLEYMNYYRKALKKSQSRQDFKDRLITEIGRMMKNDVFLDIAIDDGFTDSTEIVNDLKIWEQKWTYDVYRAEILKDITVTDEEMHDFFKHRWRELSIANVDTTRFYKYEHSVHNFLLHEKHMQRLEKKLAKLRERYPVEINEELLSELELTETPKSHLTSVFARKNFSGEAVVPIADMKWLNL